MSDLEQGQWKRTKSDGPTLAYSLRRATAAGGARAVVAVIPGYADYSARYARPMAVWAERGLTSVGIDLRGHGRSGGDPGHAMKFDEYLDDVRELLALIDREAPNLPRLLFGHSFGGVVAIKSILAGLGDFRAVALSDPYFALALEVPAVKVFAAQVMSRVVPSFGLPSGLGGAQMTNSAEAARAYDSDPLIFKNARARWYTETRAAQEEVLARAREMKLPLLVTFGGADPVAKLEAAKRFFDQSGSTDKKWETLDGLKHEPLNEPEQGPVIAGRIGDWLAAHV